MDKNNYNVWNSLASNWNGYDYNTPLSRTDLYMNSKNWLGIKKKNNPFSKGNLLSNKNAITGIGGALAEPIGVGIQKGISNGLSSGVGDSIGSIGRLVGSMLMTVNPVLGAGVMGASSLIGGGINALWGKAIDEDKLRRANESISSLDNYSFAANSPDLIIAPWAVEAIQNPYKGGVFQEGWENENNGRLKDNYYRAELGALNKMHYGIEGLASDWISNSARLYNSTAYGGPLDTIDPATPIGYQMFTDRFTEKNNKTNKETTLNMFAGTPTSIFAFGGNTESNGATFSNGITHVNSGSSHEENPYGGVLMGVDSEGVPNLVEEDELVYNDYVFSNRLKVPKLNSNKKKDATLKLKVLKKYEGMTYAKAAKKAEHTTGVDERPNDTIAKQGFEFELLILARSQELQREIEKLKEMQERINQMTPEEFALIQLQLEQQAAEEQAMQEEAAQLQLIPVDLLAALNQQELISPEEAVLQQLANINSPLVHAEGGPLFENGGYKYNGISYPTMEEAEEAARLDAIRMANEALSNANEALNTSTNAAVLPTLPEYDENNPEYKALEEYNRKNKKNLSPADWDKLSDATRKKYIRLYKHSLKSKKERAQYLELLDYYNNITKATNEVTKYLEKNRKSTLTEDDINKLSEELQNRLARWLGLEIPDYNSLSNNAREDRKQSFKKEILNKASNRTIGEINEALSNPSTLHNDWTPVALDSTEGYTLKDDLLEAYDDALSYSNEDINIGKSLYGEDFQNHLENLEDFKKYLEENVQDALGNGIPRYRALLNNMNSDTRNTAKYALRNLYQVAGEDLNRYYAPTNIDEIGNYYNDTTTPNGNSFIHTLTPSASVHIDRADAIPDNIIANDNGTYSYKDYLSNPELNTNTSSLPKASNWPYAAAAGLLGALLLHNLIAPKDYAYADAVIAGAKNAGIYQPVDFKPIGNKLTYKPMDIWFKQNDLNALARATERAIANTTSPSKDAALLAAGYNSQLASGNLYRQALEYNDALKKQVEDFNRLTNIVNSQGFLDADKANQLAGITARAHELEGLKAGYAMRQDIDNARLAAISAGLTGLANLGLNYALNKYGQDVINWRLAHNQYPISSYGGKLRKRRKGLI